MLLSDDFNKLSAQLSEKEFKFDFDKKGNVQITRAGRKGKAVEAEFRNYMDAWSASADDFLDNVRAQAAQAQADATADVETPMLRFVAVNSPYIDKLHVLNGHDYELFEGIHVGMQPNVPQILVRKNAKTMEFVREFFSATSRDASSITSALCACKPLKCRRLELEYAKQLEAKRTEWHANWAKAEHMCHKSFNSEVEYISAAESHLYVELKKSPEIVGIRSMNDELWTRIQDMLDAVSQALHGITPDAAMQAAASMLPVTLLKSANLRIYYYSAKGMSPAFECFTLACTAAEFVQEVYKYLCCPEFQMQTPVPLSNDPTTPCLQYIDLCQFNEELAKHPTPAWDRFACRFPSAAAFRTFQAAVWSVYDANNLGRQLIYLSDFGYSGKSAVLKAIGSLLEPALVCSLQKDSLSNQFGLAKVAGRRLVTFNDTKNPNLIRTEKVHLITGGDLVDVEEKGQASHPERMFCKVFAAANIQQQIDAQARNERSRILPFELNVKTEDLIKDHLIKVDAEGNPVLDSAGQFLLLGDPTYEKRLVAEFPAFLAKCREPYKELCPNGAEIIPCEDNIRLINEYDEDEADFYAEFFAKAFIVTGKESDTAHLLDVQKQLIIYRDVNKLDQKVFTKEGFVEYMRRRKHIKPTKDADGCKVYVGYLLKTEAQQSDDAPMATF